MPSSVKHLDILKSLINIDKSVVDILEHSIKFGCFTPKHSTTSNGIQNREVPAIQENTKMNLQNH